MEAKEFIIERLKEIFSSFKDINIRYEFRNSINTHIIEVNPIDVFQKNTEYINKEIELEDSFLELFPSEEILFVSEDSLTQIINPILKLNRISETVKYSHILLHPIFGESGIIYEVMEAGQNQYALAA